MDISNDGGMCSQVNVYTSMGVCHFALKRYDQPRPSMCKPKTVLVVNSDNIIHIHHIFLFEFVTNVYKYRFTCFITTFFIPGNCVVFIYRKETAIQGQATFSP